MQYKMQTKTIFNIFAFFFLFFEKGTLASNNYERLLNEKYEQENDGHDTHLL